MISKLRLRCCINAVIPADMSFSYRRNKPVIHKEWAWEEYWTEFRRQFQISLGHIDNERGWGRTYVYPPPCPSCSCVVSLDGRGGDGYENRAMEACDALCNCIYNLWTNPEGIIYEEHVRQIAPRAYETVIPSVRNTYCTVYAAIASFSWGTTFLDLRQSS
jgi:hypothetical protein